jgi:hypothetical protein
MIKLNAFVELIKRIFPYLVVAALVSVLCVVFADPISRNGSHEWRMWLAVLSVAMIAVRLLKPLVDKREPLRKWA